MICQSCRDGIHKCKGCDCQHKVRDVNVITDHLAENCQDKDCKAHSA